MCAEGAGLKDNPIVGDVVKVYHNQSFKKCLNQYLFYLFDLSSIAVGIVPGRNMVGQQRPDNHTRQGARGSDHRSLQRGQNPRPDIKRELVEQLLVEQPHVDLHHHLPGARDHMYFLPTFVFSEINRTTPLISTSKSLLYFFSTYGVFIFRVSHPLSKCKQIKIKLKTK
jgi:hypothetical protein